MAINKIEVPRRMQHLKLDRRGYPIPANVLVDAQGRPHFTINNEEIRRRQILQKRCPICDGRLTPNRRWFVGGYLSAFHPAGAYIDLPMHAECSRYALRVCPYLAAPAYAREIGTGTLKPDSGLSALLIDNTMIPGRPAEDIFVAVLARGYTVIGDYTRLRPTRPYIRVMFWRWGQQIPDSEALERLGLSPCTKPQDG